MRFILREALLGWGPGEGLPSTGKSISLAFQNDRAHTAPPLCGRARMPHVVLRDDTSSRVS